MNDLRLRPAHQGLGVRKISPKSINQTKMVNQKGRLTEIFMMYSVKTLTPAIIDLFNY